jgi:cellulose biosynthesis protein BcsQ
VAKLLQHFLTKVATHQKAKLLDCCTPVRDGSMAIIPATDTLGYAESSLTMQWLFGYGKRDVRFLLRRGLQQKPIVRRFDIVLLDCPPILNVCCLNALAASDYVLIPAVPSRSAARRVPLFLGRQRQPTASWLSADLIAVRSTPPKQPYTFGMPPVRLTPDLLLSESSCWATPVCGNWARGGHFRRHLYSLSA